MRARNENEELLLQAVKTQYAILKLLDSTLLDTYRFEKGLPENQQNSEVINLSYNVRSIIAKKPKLKEIYKKIEAEYGISLSDN
ncbi:hypothetical protein OEV98_14690 [Caldibacillus lycopersici]|uniref:Uncharacterized protein n=1 Tax=Perspicuibacillus lycopersici TaxID=1325689 RepID=A0AAE3LTZ3_9BACI|nr:hypothetical protein [Perspicuibacillus lycopersici]MCU9614788.1 hypothetical protein [Perspicuibacillus lycopersici]